MKAGEDSVFLRFPRNRIIRAIRATPARAPTVIPAIWPPESPEPPLELDATDPVAAEGVTVVVNMGGKEVVVGKLTFSHRCSALEL